jgi:hypothetical protein
VREQIELLEDDPEPLPDLGYLHALPRELEALEPDRPESTGSSRFTQRRKRALPAAARPDHHEHLAGGDLEVDVRSTTFSPKLFVTPSRRTTVSVEGAARGSATEGSFLPFFHRTFNVRQLVRPDFTEGSGH